MDTYHSSFGGTFTVSRWFSTTLLNTRSSSHQHTSGNPAFFAASSRLHRFQAAALISARGEYKSSRKSARTCNSIVVRLALLPQSARHPKRPYAGNSNGSLHVPSPHTSSTHTGNAVSTSQSKICAGFAIDVTAYPSPSRGTTARRTELTTAYAWYTSACMNTTTK